MKKKGFFTLLILILLPVAISSQDITNGLVGYWPFNNNYEDISNNENHGVAVGNPTFVTDRYGNENYAIELDGSNDCIELNSLIDISTIDVWSAFAWIKYNDNIDVQSALLSGYAFQIIKSNHKLSYYDGVGYKYSDEAINVDTWVHVGICINKSLNKVYFYINGLQKGKKDIDGTYSNSNRIKKIGTFNLVNQDHYLFKGVIDDLLIFNRALSEAEIQQLSNNYSLIVTNGTGSGMYESGQVIDILADTAPEGHIFDQWTGDISYITNPTAVQTTLTMPPQDITITAAYKVITSAWNTNGSDIYYNEGNTGIGTSTPGYKLDVNGDINFTGQLLQNGNPINSGSSPWNEITGGISYSNNIGIGTSNTFGYKLAVNGIIGAKEVNIEVESPWPDYVFDTDYSLLSINELEQYITRHKHLPEIPTAEEAGKNGISVGEMNTVLLKKIEELTLYMIRQNNEIEILKQKINELEK